MELEVLLSKYDFPKRTIHYEVGVDEIEKSTKFPLPADYKFYLENFFEHECFIGPEYLRLWDNENLLENNDGYQIFTYLTNTLAIGSNGGGEFIAIEYSTHGQYRIVLSPFIDLDKQNYIEIGDSFTDMLMRLDNGNEWFN